LPVKSGMVWNTILDTLLPTNCVCCGEPPSPVCRGCIAAPKPVVVSRGNIFAAVSASLDENLSKLITAFKDGGQLSLASKLASLSSAALELSLDFGRQENSTSGVAITWVPSSRAALRRRGFDANHILLKRTMRLRKLYGLPTLPLVLPLRHLVPARDQSGLGRSARFANTRGRFSASYRREPLLVFDDIITTGATITAAASALEAAGCQVLGGFAIAETPLLGTASGASRII
jgi:predicted amidophosphoribosyltransferase